MFRPTLTPNTSGGTGDGDGHTHLPTDDFTANYVIAGRLSDDGDGNYVQNGGGILIGGMSGVRYRQEGFIADFDEGSIASYPQVPNRPNRLALCPSGDPANMPGEDTASFALQHLNGSIEQRFCLISKKAGEYRLASVTTPGGSHFPITVAPGDYRIVRFETDASTTFTAQPLAGGPAVNTVVRIGNSAVTQSMRIFGRTTGKFGFEYVDGPNLMECRLNSVGFSIGGVDATSRRVTASVSEAGIGGFYGHFTNAGYTGVGVGLDADRTSSTAFAYLLARSNTAGALDIEFNLRGDGNAFADGAWGANGADYAEYFEWLDGNPDGEDRVGLCVVLEGDMIRVAGVGEDPIGVVSSAPSVVGNAAWNSWQGKYVTDDFGRVDLGPDGVPVLNPSFDPELDYVPREARREWSPVGMMGRLRLRKGQQTGSRWIKLAQVSADVEEWLVR